jgi:hypothetical protein
MFFGERRWLKRICVLKKGEYQKEEGQGFFSFY